MRKAIALLLTLCFFALSALSSAIATNFVSPVPDEPPADWGGKTPYGYLMDLKSQYTPAMVFQDAVKYTDQDRENARRAAQLIAAITTTLMENGLSRLGCSDTR